MVVLLPLLLQHQVLLFSERPPSVEAIGAALMMMIE